MTNTQNTAAKNLAEMLARKFNQALANGATDEQALTAVRALWLEALEG